MRNWRRSAVATVTSDEREVWESLANLLFLDTEPLPSEFEHAAQMLKNRGWNLQRVESNLIELVAPVVGPNLLVAAGVWAGFDSDWLIETIERRRQWRAKQPRWRLRLSDSWHRRCFVRGNAERLLDLLA